MVDFSKQQLPESDQELLWKRTNFEDWLISLVREEMTLDLDKSEASLLILALSLAVSNTEINPEERARLRTLLFKVGDMAAKEQGDDHSRDDEHGRQSSD